MRKDFVFYRIYPKSFCDSNGDGIGDIKGIADKIPYLSSLGINAILICPIVNCDESGVLDYYSFEKGLGSIEDFKLLIEKLNEKNIVSVVEIPLLYTSTEHEWFKNAKKDENGKYADYYCTDSENLPKLNWESIALKEEFKKIFDFYLNLGVKGFVLNFRSDSKKAERTGLEQNKKAVSYLHEIFDDKKYQDVLLICDCNVKNFREEFYLSKKGKGVFDLVFTTNHLCLDKKDLYNGAFSNKKTAEKFPMKSLFYRTRNRIWDTFDFGTDYTLFLENDKLPRSVSRICSDEETFRYQCATMLGTNLILLKGIPFIYQGEEIAVTNGFYDDISFFKDKKTLALYEKYSEKMNYGKLMRALNMGSADNSKRFMPWNSNNNKKPWIADYNKKTRINLESDIESKNSVSAFYKELIALRMSSEAIQKGSFRVIKLSKSHCIYERRYKKETILVMNSFDCAKKINLNRYSKYELLLTNYEEVTNVLMPYQTAIFRKK